MSLCCEGIVHTGVNFIEKSESCATVRFVRVTYVRHSNCADDHDVVGSRTATSPANGFSYKTFVPAPVTVGMCSGTPNYESFSSTWDRAKAWLKLVGPWTHVIFLLLRWHYDTLCTPTSSCLKITHRSFRYTSPYSWNQLPTSLRQPHFFVLYIRLTHFFTHHCFLF